MKIEVILVIFSTLNPKKFGAAHLTLHLFTYFHQFLGHMYDAKTGKPGWHEKCGGEN